MTLTDLGWSAHFSAQTKPGEEALAARVSSVARDRLTAITVEGTTTAIPPSGMSMAEFAVGDWVILSPDKSLVTRRLTPQTELTRRAAGTGAKAQLIAGNVDTLGIVTSCNADFNEARLERYLALAASAGCLPLVVLTKADLVANARDYVRRAERLSPLVIARAVNALDEDDAESLASWCRKGQTLALVGSSGVGKSTLANALTGAELATQGIREDDAKGRHTTTARGLHRTRFGGWLIDTPGMRELQLVDASDGIGVVFEDIEQLALECRFSDCAHETEPGCAVRAAVERGDVTQERVDRWRKLLREDAMNSETIHEARARDRAFGKMVRSAIKDRHSRK